MTDETRLSMRSERTVTANSGVASVCRGCMAEEFDCFFESVGFITYPYRSLDRAGSRCAFGGLPSRVDVIGSSWDRRISRAFKARPTARDGSAGHGAVGQLVYGYTAKVSKSSPCAGHAPLRSASPESTCARGADAQRDADLRHGRQFARAPRRLRRQHAEPEQEPPAEKHIQLTPMKRPWPPTFHGRISCSPMAIVVRDRPYCRLGRGSARFRSGCEPGRSHRVSEETASAQTGHDGNPASLERLDQCRELHLK